jgi:DNA polymerase III subunit epsilon
VTRQPRSTPWREAAYAVVDVETTGLDARRDEVVSFGAVPVDDGRIRCAAATYLLVRPAQDLPERSILVHGIRPLDLAAAPDMAGQAHAIRGAVAGRVLVAHAAFVERRFLQPILRARLDPRPLRIVDTAVLARLWWRERGLRDPGFVELPRLAAALGLPIHQQHHALGDALTTAQVFLALATHLDSVHAQTLGSLAAAAARLDVARQFGS